MDLSNNSFHEDLAAVFRAIANPIRLRILKYLLQNTACINADLVDILPKAQATISQHLKVLIAAGLVVVRTEGKYSVYELNQSRYSEAMNLIQLFIMSFRQHPSDILDIHSAIFTNKLEPDPLITE